MVKCDHKNYMLLGKDFNAKDDVLWCQDCGSLNRDGKWVLPKKLRAKKLGKTSRVKTKRFVHKMSVMP